MSFFISARIAAVRDAHVNAYLSKLLSLQTSGTARPEKVLDQTEIEFSEFASLISKTAMSASLACMLGGLLASVSAGGLLLLGCKVERPDKPAN